MRTIVTAMLVLLIPLTASGQELNLSKLEEAPNRVHLKAGAEHAFVAAAGYSRVLPFFDRQLVLNGEVTLPWAQLDVFDYGLRIGALGLIVGSPRWKLAGSLAPTLRGTENKASRMTSLGADIALIGGYYAESWLVAGELGFAWALTTHVTHTDLYRRLAYADARDGWYGNPGGNLRAGIHGGASFDRYDIVLRVGLVRDVSFEAPMLPFYGTLTLAARF